MNDMQIVWKDVKDIIPYDKNPRKNDDAVQYVANSIKEFGWKQPIVVDKNNIIIAGHTRLKAAIQLGQKQVPVLYANLTDIQVKAYRLADNKTNEFAEWDMDLLDFEMDILDDEMFDMTQFGFLDDFDPYIVEDEYDEPPPEDPISKQGDIWLLGRHRLMCGDSTTDDVDILMDGNKADMVFTDPPYNIDYKGLTGKHDKIKNDKMSDEDFISFLEKSIMKAKVMYVCCSWQYSNLFKTAMKNIGCNPKAMIIWDKVNPAQNLDKYYKQHEMIFYYGKFGGERTLRGDVWEIKRQRNTVHPTMKPIELISIALNDNKDSVKVYDGFGGSGSTLIASEQLNRICYMMELDEKYIDVIVNRYIAFVETDEDVWLIRDGKKIPYNEVS